jgi:hypothetical protein
LNSRNLDPTYLTRTPALLRSFLQGFLPEIGTSV